MRQNATSDRSTAEPLTALRRMRAVVAGRRRKRPLFSFPSVAACLILLAGCAALPTPVVIDEISFAGMSRIADEAPGRPLHVLLIHGMGTPQPNGFDPFIASLGARFGLVQMPPAIPGAQDQGCYKATPAQPALLQPAPEPIDNPAAAPQDRALLYTYDFGPTQDGPKQLIVSYLLWSPLTEGVKCGLERQDADAPPKQAFASTAKDFIDDKLADALLYAGDYRKEVMRPSVQGALCRVTGGTWDAIKRICAPGPYEDPTVIITHSLGGYMFMDAVQAELQDDCRAATGGGAAQRILENTPAVFMMANQLALLDLSTLHRDPQAPKHTSATETATRRFARCWVEARAHAAARLHGANAPAPLSQVVAFSDPNDILSWLVDENNLPKAKIKLTNVFLSNSEFSVPGLFAEPATAHTGYFVNPKVMDMLICGMQNGVVGTCGTQTVAR